MIRLAAHEDSVITYLKGTNRKNLGLFGKHRQKLIMRCKSGETLNLHREPNNPVDSNAIKVCNQKMQQLGYLSKYVASKVAPLMDSGKPVKARVHEIRDSGKQYECLVEISAENVVWDKDRNPLDISKPSDLGLKEIGITDAVCPYCSSALETMPRRKKKCPECGNFMYVRTRPLDREKILITEQQIPEIEEQWAIANGRHEEFLTSRQQYEDTKAKLREKFGREPAEHDVQWAIYNKELMEHARNGDWGLYRNVRFNMAEILREESRDKPALSTYLEVCYLDLNGPDNIGGLDNPELLQQFPPFDPKLAFLAPAVLSRINGLVKKLELDHAKTRAIFDKISALQHKNLRLPVSPDRAWRKLKKELFG